MTERMAGKRTKAKPWVERLAQRLRVSVAKRWNKLHLVLQGRALKKRPGIVFSQDSSPSPDAPPPDGITVILNVYARPEYLREQISAVRAQNVPPSEIWIWSNRSEKPSLDWSPYCDRLVVSNHNWKFFGRFALGLMAQTKYVAFIDDDILPAERWFENCLKTIQQPAYNGILGGAGVRLPAGGGYVGEERVGWNGKLSDTTLEVDLVGHSWFMEKRHLALMWREEPFSLENGEDMHLSYVAQKYGELKTFVPPHPVSDKTLWSARPIRSTARSKDGQAHSVAHKNEHNDMRNRIVDDYRANGWRIMNDRRPD